MSRHAKLLAFLVLLAALYPGYLGALELTDMELGFTAGQNSGIHVFEIGSKYPDLTGYSGGSRITYQRDFRNYGPEAGARLGPFFLHGGFLWTGHGVDSGGARDEDFFTDSRTREVGAKVDLAHGTFRDTANTFQGTRNWADAKARATIVEYRIHTDARWYPGDTLHGTRDGFYVTAGLSYEFFWYHVFDVVQFIDSRPIFLGPIGDGLTFSNNITELPVGAGWTLKWKALTFDSNVRIVTGENRARDFHIQRGINFLAHTYGSGFRWSVSAKAQATSEWKFGIDWEARRFFGRGQVKTTGLNLVYNFAPPQRVYIDTKESWMGLSAVYLFNTPPAARQQSPSETDPLNKQR